MKILSSVKSAPGIPVLISERDKTICDRRADGLSFDKIGEEFGISRERARQICRSTERRIKRGMRLSPLQRAFANTRRNPLTV
jgi:DNA-directed RNA polymerase sigma subunit (sigma70/sigma32)